MYILNEYLKICEKIIVFISFNMHLFDDRMLPSTFEFILDQIGEKLTRATDGNEMVPADKQLLLSLWRFGTTDSYRQVLKLHCCQKV